jgi:hypothetical protein
MRIATEDFIEGLSFCKRAILKTKHWAHALLFIQGENLFVWDGEQAARFPMKTDIEFTIYLDSVWKLARALRDESAETIELSVVNGFLMLNDHLAGEAFTEFGAMPDLTKRHTIELTQCENFVSMLRSFTRVLDPPSWVATDMVFISDRATFGSDGICAFYAPNDPDCPLYKHRHIGGQPSSSISWRFCKTLSRMDVPERIRIGTDRVSAQWQHGGELMSSAVRSDDVCERVRAWVAPESHPVKGEMALLLKTIRAAQKDNEVESIGIFPFGDLVGMEIGSVYALTDGTGTESPKSSNALLDPGLDCPQFYLNGERLRKILDVVHSFDAQDFSRANSENVRQRHVRFYGNSPAPFIVALGIQR